MTVIVITFLFTFEFFYSILFYWYWFSTVLFLSVRQGYCVITTFLFSSLVAVLLFLYKIQDMNWIFRSIHFWRLKQWLAGRWWWYSIFLKHFKKSACFFCQDYNRRSFLKGRLPFLRDSYLHLLLFFVDQQFEFGLLLF